METTVSMPIFFSPKALGPLVRSLAPIGWHRQLRKEERKQAGYDVHAKRWCGFVGSSALFQRQLNGPFLVWKSGQYSEMKPAATDDFGERLDLRAVLCGNMFGGGSLLQKAGA